MSTFRTCIGVDRLQPGTVYHFLLLLPGDGLWPEWKLSLFDFATLKLEVVTCAYSYLIIIFFCIKYIDHTHIFSFVNFLFISLACFLLEDFFLAV